MDTRLIRLIMAFLFVILLGGRQMLISTGSHNLQKAVVPPEMVIDIGSYQSLKSEQRASLKRISSELHKHPEASGIRIVSGPSPWRHGVMGYLRMARLEQNNRAFWFDSRFSSPDFGMIKGKFQGISVIRLFSEEEIHVVARRNGVAEDVENCNYNLGVQAGQYPPPPTIPVKSSRKSL